MHRGPRTRLVALAAAVLGTLMFTGDALEAQQRSRGQQTILAFEAARADAYRNLLESVKGLEVEGGTTVENLAVANSEIRTRVEEFIRGAEIVDETIDTDGTARVTVELDIDRLERLLGRSLPGGIRQFRMVGYGAPQSPEQAQQQQQSQAASSGVQSAVVGSPFAWNREPEPQAQFNNVVMVTGTAAQDPSRARSAAQARLLAERAATQDAYRRILEYVYGISVSSTTTVRDLALSSDRVDSEVSGFIRGAKIEDVRHTPDGIAEVDMSLDLSGLQRIINP